MTLKKIFYHTCYVAILLTIIFQCVFLFLNPTLLKQVFFSPNSGFVSVLVSILFLSFWVKCIIVWYKKDKKTSRLILLLILNFYYTVYYYPLIIKNNWL